MLYHSELLKKNFKTEDECLAAEKEFKDYKRERAARADELKVAYQEALDAINTYFELREKYLEDFGFLPN